MTRLWAAVLVLKRRYSTGQGHCVSRSANAPEAVADDSSDQVDVPATGEVGVVDFEGLDSTIHHLLVPFPANKTASNSARCHTRMPLLNTTTRLLLSPCN